jgi:hypothetical protein
MKFMLISHDDEQYWEDVGPAVHEKALGEAIELTHELARKGQYLYCSPLQRSNTATLVRVRDGKTSVTAGPYAETREAIGGFYLIEADSVEEAAAIAARHPGARHGTVEVRQIIEVEGLPKSKL